MLYIARYTPRDRKTDAGREHRLGRQLLRYGLEQEYGRTWEAVCGPHGRPVLAEGPEGLQFSITHTRGLAACLIGERNLGLDAEQIRPSLVMDPLHLHQKRIDPFHILFLCSSYLQPYLLSRTFRQISRSASLLQPSALPSFATHRACAHPAQYSGDLSRYISSGSSSRTSPL